MVRPLTFLPLVFVACATATPLPPAAQAIDWRRDRPSGEMRALGELSCQRGGNFRSAMANVTTCRNKLRIEAAALGADTIVVSSEQIGAGECANCVVIVAQAFRSGGPADTSVERYQTAESVALVFRPVRLPPIRMTYAPRRSDDSALVELSAPAQGVCMIDIERAGMPRATFPLRGTQAWIPISALASTNGISISVCGTVWNLSAPQEQALNDFRQAARRLYEHNRVAGAAAAPMQAQPAATAAATTTSTTPAENSTSASVRQRLDSSGALVHACVPQPGPVGVLAEWDAAGVVSVSVPSAPDAASTPCIQAALGEFRVEASAAGRLLHVVR